jgi:hypothetical protein
MRNFLRKTQLGSFFLDSSAKSRYLAYAIIITVSAVLAWRFQWDMLFVPAGVATALILLEIFSFYKKYMWIAVIILAQVYAVSMLIYITYFALFFAEVSGSVAFFVFVVNEIIAITGVIVASITAFTLTRGKIWFTLLLSFVAFDLTYVLLIAYANQIPGFTVVTDAILAFVALIAVLVIKLYLPRYKSEEFDPKSLGQNRKTTAVKTSVEKRLAPDYKELPIVDNELNAFGFLHRNRVYFVVPVNPERSFKLQKNSLVMDGTPVTGLLEAVLSQAGKFASQHKLKGRNVVPVLYVKNNNQAGKLITVKVASKNYPDRSLGALHITTPEGFYALLKRVKTSKQGELKEKQLASL